MTPVSTSVEEASEGRASHRQREIVRELERAGGLMRIGPLARALGVSEQTVRRNVRRLAEDGIVEVMHGGARLLEREQESDFRHRMLEHPEAKRRIARHVAGMIDDGASLFLDIGSTTAYIADALRDHRRLLVATNSVHVAYRLAMRNGNRVFIAGGELRAHDGGVFGADAMDFAANFRTDCAILSAAAIDPDSGFMLFDLQEAQFSRRIMNRASVRIVAADSSKFGREAPVSVGDPSLVDHLVCERDPPPAIRAAARRWATEIHVAR